jgi:hypothetical protein
MTQKKVTNLSTIMNYFVFIIKRFCVAYLHNELIINAKTKKQFM